MEGMYSGNTVEGKEKRRVRGLAERLAELVTPRPARDVDRYGEEEEGMDAGVAYRRHAGVGGDGDFGEDDDDDGYWSGDYVDNKYGDDDEDDQDGTTRMHGVAEDGKNGSDVKKRKKTKAVSARVNGNGEPRLRLRASIALEDGAYRGQTSSRAHVFEKLPSAPGETTDDGEEEEEEEEDDDAAAAAAVALRNQFEDDEEEEDINEEEKELRALEAELHDDGNMICNAGTSSADATLHNDDENGFDDENGDAVAALRGIHERARIQARRVREQCALWEKSLGLRIRLQRAVVPGANKLPVGRAHANACSSSGRVSDAFNVLGRSAAQLLVDLLDCQQQMLAACGGDVNAKTEAMVEERERRRNQRQRQQQQGKRQKRKHHAMTSDDDEDHEEDEEDEMEETLALESRLCWNYLTKAHAEAKEYADAALDEWQKKALIATGGVAAAASAMKLQSFVGKSFSEQVASYIDASEAKLRRKLHLTNGEAPERIGARINDEDSGDEEPDNDDSNDNNANRVANDANEREMEEAQKSQAEALDYETFDDTDFYAQLLHEFLDSKGLKRAGADNSAVAGGVNVAKRRKKVDRNASKGRKLRFHVMEKLVNFMAPVECSRPVFAEQLFSNLFGGGR